MVEVRADQILHHFLDQQTWSPAVTSAAVFWSDSCNVNAELLCSKEMRVVYLPHLQEGRMCQPEKCIHNHQGSVGVSQAAFRGCCSSRGCPGAWARMQHRQMAQTASWMLPGVDVLQLWQSGSCCTPRCEHVLPGELAVYVPICPYIWSYLPHTIARQVKGTVCLQCLNN